MTAQAVNPLAYVLRESGLHVLVSRAKPGGGRVMLGWLAYRTTDGAFRIVDAHGADVGELMDGDEQYEIGRRDPSDRGAGVVVAFGLAGPTRTIH
jgi:hypothetical protein